MTWMQLVQWLLLLWLVSLFLRSILEIFKLDGLDHIVTGLLFVLIGFAWIATMYWKFDIQRIFFPYFIQSSIGLLFATYGIRMIWKKPIGSAVTCVVILLVSGFFYYNAPSMKEDQSNFVSRYFPFLSSGIIQKTEENTGNTATFGFGLPSDEKLEIHSNIGNLFFNTESLPVLFKVKPGTVVESLQENRYQIGNTEEKTSIQIHNQLEELLIKKDVGNIQGTVAGTFENIILDSDAGNIHLDLSGKIESLSCHLNMGNLEMRIFSMIPTVTAKVDVGNITIHIAKGLRVETDSIKTNVGQIKIEQNGDGSIGTINLKAETNIGNIVIIADL